MSASVHAGRLTRFYEDQIEYEVYKRNNPNWANEPFDWRKMPPSIRAQSVLEMAVRLARLGPRRAYRPGRSRNC